jgi:hypothetical protein
LFLFAGDSFVGCSIGTEDGRLLPIFKAVLWLIFFILAYPLALAFTVDGRLPSRDLKEIYIAGIAQIPFLGGIISPFLNPTPPDDAIEIVSQSTGRINNL